MRPKIESCLTCSAATIKAAGDTQGFDCGILLALATYSALTSSFPKPEMSKKKKKKTGQRAESTGLNEPERTFRSGVFIRWLLIRWNGNMHTRRVSAYWSPLIFHRDYWAIIPYFCTTSSQLEIDGPNGGRGRRTVTRLFFCQRLTQQGRDGLLRVFLCQSRCY